MANPNDIEQILISLTVPDSKTIQQATAQLIQVFTNPNIVPALIQILVSSANPIVRQYAAILIRKRIVKNLDKVNDDVKNSLCAALIQTLATESEHLVRIAICQVVSAIAKHKYKQDGWPEVMQYIGGVVHSGDLKEKEVGFLLLSCICETCKELLKPFYPDLFPLFEIGLTDEASRKSAFYSIKALTSIVPSLGSDEEQYIKMLIPKTLEVVKKLVREDEEKACEALTLFDELVEVEIGIIVPYVKSLVDLCLQIVQSEDHGDTIRVKALYLLCWACRRKAKALLKSHLLGPLLDILLSLMSLAENSDVNESEDSQESVGDDDDDDDDEGEMEGSTLPSVAAQALDLLALHLPPAKFIPEVMARIHLYLGSTSEYKRKAGFIALGVLAEGCSDYIKNRHLSEALQTVFKGLSDGSYVVRNAALFTLGQFAEHFQEDMNKFHADIIPALLTQMQSTLLSQDPKQRITLTRIFYALESLCENLEKSIITLYLNSLVETFLSAIKSSKGLYATELAVSAIGSLAASAKDLLLPYFPNIMSNLKDFLEEPATFETSSLQAQAIDTLGALARNIGEENFKCMADECLQLGMTLVEDCDDPDVRRCTYALFASLSTVMKKDIGRYLNKIVPRMLDSLKSTEGFVSLAVKDEPTFLLEDDLTGEGDEADDDDDEGYTVENAYIDEKEDTCNAISELAEMTEEEFLPYIEECFTEVFLFVDDPNVGLRKAAMMSCAVMSNVLYTALKNKGATDFGPVMTLTEKTFSVALATVDNEHDQSCVMAAVDAINQLLKSFQGGELRVKELVDKIANASLTLLLGKTPCQQDGDESFAEEDEESQAEMDTILFEKAGDVLPLLAQAVGGEVFQPYFNAFFPLLAKRTKSSCAISERSFAVGTIAEVIQAMEKHCALFIDQIVQLFLGTVKDGDEEVISNSIFGLGVIAENAGAASIPYFSNILQTLFNVANSHPSALVIDNVCGAVARMIMTSANDLPIQQVLPVLVNHLPIKEDNSENETVMKCICFLYQTAIQTIEPYLGQLLPYIMHAVVTRESGLKTQTRKALKEMLIQIEKRSPSEFMSVVEATGINPNSFTDSL